MIIPDLAGSLGPRYYDVPSALFAAEEVTWFYSPKIIFYLAITSASVAVSSYISWPEITVKGTSQSTGKELCL